MVLVGCVQLGAYRVAVHVASESDAIASPQPDTYLYCQAARRVAEGHPFSYSEGEKASTGTTSVLYPFALAVPYALGFKGPSLLTAGFFLNGFFYLVFLFGWGFAARCWVTRDEGEASQFGLFAAGTLIALAAQPAICAFGQTDTAMWMATSAVFAALVAARRWRWAAFVAFLGPWVRPEGAILAFAATAIGFGGWAWAKWGRASADGRPGETLRLLAAGLCGLLGLAAVFAFNYWLTGRCQFDSVAHKGYFKMYGAADAAIMTVRDAIAIVKGFAFGVEGVWPRSLFCLPILGGVFIWIGVATRRWRFDGFSALVLASLGGMALVASSGWQGSNFDRYLAWTAPVLALLTARGVVALSRVRALANVRYLPVALAVGFAAFASLAGACSIFLTTRNGRARDEFFAACEAEMKSGESAGGLSCSAAYAFSSRRFVHLGGLYSPDFFGFHLEANWVEQLKHRKDLRFVHWLAMTTGAAFVAPADRDAVLGEIELIGPEGMELRRPDWRAFEAAAAVPKGPAGQELVARVDVGYLPDEKASEYEVVDRWGRKVPDPFATARHLPSGAIAVEGGRAFQGGDLMTVPLRPGRDCTVVMRTVSKQDGMDFKSPLKLRLEVDGEAAGWATCAFGEATNDFQEVAFTIPGRAIAKSPCRVAFLGDHAPCAYWFWQSGEETR